MRSYLKFALLFSLALLSACATAVNAPLPGAAREKISSTDVVLPVKQNEIYVFVPDSQLTAAAGGGLLFALIDAGINSARTSKAEDAVKPLRDSLVDFSFDTAFQDEFKSSLSNASWLHLSNVRVIKEVSNESMDRALTDSRAGAVLFATPDYHLSNDGDVLYVSLRVALFANDEALKAVQPADKSKSASKSAPKTAPELSLYRNTLQFRTRLFGASMDRDKNMATWSADKGAAMRSTLKLGATKLGMLLVNDLQRSAEDAAATAKNAAATRGKKDTTSVELDGLVLPGELVGSDDDGQIVRLKDGRLAFVANEVH